MDLCIFRETLDELQNLSIQVIAEQQKIAQMMEQDQNCKLPSQTLKLTLYSEIFFKAQKRQQLVEWLEPMQYNIKHDDSIRLRQEGTCSWLFEEDIFIRWYSLAGFLWLHGIRK